MFSKVFKLFLIIVLMFFSVSCRRPSLNRKKASSTDREQYHIVQSGETLYQIARNYNVSLNQITKLNSISNPDVIETGDKILLLSASEVTDEKNISNKSFSVSTEKDSKKPKSIEKNVEVTARQNDSQVTSGSKEVFLINPLENGHLKYKFGDLKNGIRVEGMEFTIDKELNVLAADSGDVVYVDNNPSNRIIIIEHENNYYTVYSNISSSSVKMGDVVAQKDIIGSVKSDDRFYFELRKFIEGGSPQALNPQKYMR
ncbi:MAG: peptidoglycan DD-metalloendopeptidase family protein [Candidatus Muiribacteriota bacterium]